MASRSARARAKSQLQRRAVEEEDGDDFLEDAGTASDSKAVEVNSSDEEDDYGKDKKTARTKAPATKRTKTSSSAKAKLPLKHKNRQEKNLSLLPTMPLDVLFEILRRLNPMDIVNVARTSKIFRETLTSHGAVTVWKAARERRGAPEPPSDMTEPGWAALLFGNACQNCGAKQVKAVDFMLRRRLCLKCKKSGIFVESRLKKDLRILDKTVFDLVPHTETGPWANNRSNSRFFWKEDVERMLLKVAALEQDVLTGRQDAKAKLHEFKQKQRNIVQDIHSSARQYQQWVKKDDRDRQTDKDTLVERRREAIYDRLREMGHDERDFIRLKFEPELGSTVQLTDRIWKRILPILEPQILQFQEERLAAERATLMDSRRNIMHDLYQTYQRSLVPSQWKYLPRTLDICELEPFAQLIEAPTDVVVTAEDFGNGMKMLLALLSSLSERKLEEFRDVLRVEKTDLSDNAHQPDAVASSPHNPVDPLELATSVFQCEGQCIRYHERCSVIGVEELMTHHCDADYTLFFNRSAMSWNFSLRGAQTASSLVQLAGLDPKTASVSDMDQKDLRFTCRLCKPVQVSANLWMANGYSWRRAVSHAVRYSPHWHRGTRRESPVEGCSWQVLPATVAEEVKSKERIDPKWDAKLWTCGRCSLYMTDLQDRGDIVRHLAAMHATLEPEEPGDLFMFERFSRDFEQKIGYSVPKPES
ncbi:hypothetical protein GALMADRAFT_247009 [Galerina marginata CBS 339.88]|uniref:F-box domain-containing protein n=1 Tax=Galerina marginata (strain CBS 339.88) TaxID=685588 RepID=A0A067T2Q0_GALM3|nr:hypothetical protein GALMADRAFT_247009 [Galerina marginata CBS 339.88]